MEDGQLEKALQRQNEIISAGCQPGAKLCNALVRESLRAGSMTKAVEVVHCAYPLPGHGFTAPQRAFGMSTKVLEDLVVLLNQGERAVCMVARSLVADLQRCSGVTLQDNVCGSPGDG